MPLGSSGSLGSGFSKNSVHGRKTTRGARALISSHDAKGAAGQPLGNSQHGPARRRQSFVSITYSGLCDPQWRNEPEIEQASEAADLVGAGIAGGDRGVEALPGSLSLSVSTILWRSTRKEKRPARVTARRAHDRCSFGSKRCTPASKYFVKIDGVNRLERRTGMAPEIEELYRYDKDLQVSRYLQQRDELMDELDRLSIPSPPKGQMILVRSLARVPTDPVWVRNSRGREGDEGGARTSGGR